jgi:hypothetical protein
MLCSDISPDIDDMVAIELRVGADKYCVISYYCPPGANIDLNTDLLEQYLARYNHLVLLGDLNAKHLYYGSQRTDSRGEILFDFVERNDLLVLNDPNEMTRHAVSTGHSDLIDYAIVSRAVSRQGMVCYVGEDVSSDHFPVHLRLKLRCRIDEVPVRQVRIYAKCDWNVFNEKLAQASDHLDASPLASTVDIEEQCKRIRESISDAIDDACPKQLVKDYAFRVTAGTLKLIRLKRKLRRLCQRQPGNAELKTLYNRTNAFVSKEIQRERQTAWANVTESLDYRAGAQFWKKFNNLTGTSKTGNSRGIGLTTDTGEVSADPGVVCDIFAKMLGKAHQTHTGPEFCGATKAEVDTHVVQHTASYVPCFTVHCEPGDTSHLADTVTTDEVSGALRLCKTKSSPGADGIPYTVLKRLPAFLLVVIARLYTACLIYGYFPLEWKQAVGVMLLKAKKDGKCPSNYRPISLLSTIGKLFEKIISRRMQAHFVEIGFFNDWQRAYLRKKEASEHIYRIGEEIRLARAKGWMTSVVSLDVEKAFDSVWHDGIRYKLSGLDLPVKLVRLLSSFLTDRSIRVKTGDKLSEAVALKAGTPQGSVLSPLLYLIYVNDVPILPSNNCRGGQFADDLSLWTSYCNKRVVGMRLQRALTEIEKWCSKWRIKINVAKTQLTSFEKKRRQKLKLKLFNEDIVEQPSLTILGVTFEQSASYTLQCRAKAAKAMQRINLMKRLRGKTWGSSPATLLRLYKQYVRPVLETGFAVTSRACKTARLLLMRAEYCALRVAMRLDKRTKIKELYRASNVMPLSRRLRLLRDKAVNRFGDSACMRELATTKQLLATTRRRRLNRTR